MSDIDIAIHWEDGRHEVLYYDDDTGYGLTGCRKTIGPWDVFLDGPVDCAECLKNRERRATEARHKVPGPKEWFPVDAQPAQRKEQTVSYSDFWIYAGERRPVVVHAPTKEEAEEKIRKSPQYDGFGATAQRVEDFAKLCESPRA